MGNRALVGLCSQVLSMNTRAHSPKANLGWRDYRAKYALKLRALGFRLAVRDWIASCRTWESGRHGLARLFVTKEDERAPFGWTNTELP